MDAVTADQGLALSLHPPTASGGREQEASCGGSRLPALILAALTACVQLQARADNQATPPDPASNLAEAIQENRPIARRDYLRLLLGKPSQDAALLIRGLAASDGHVRRLAALQLGELPTHRLNPRVVSALLAGAADADATVAAQAMASILRIGSIAPASLIPHVRDETPLRRFTYRSASANGWRALQVSGSDLVIASLLYGSPTNVDELVRAYADAKQAAAVNRNGDRPDPQSEFESSEESTRRTPDYFARALVALLEHAPDANRTLVLRLMETEDSELRRVAYGAASKVTANPADVAARLAKVVREGPTEADRIGAARALASQGELGQAELLKLIRMDHAGVRAAALASLLEHADCASPWMGLLFAERDPAVRQAGLAAVLGSERYFDVPFSCLVALTTDSSLSAVSRSFILHSLSMHARNAVGERVKLSLPEATTILEPLLSDPESELYSDAWEVMRALLEASDGGSAAVAGIARARLQKSNAAADGDAHLLCALSSLDAGILAADPTLLSLIAERMGQERSSDECIAAVLSEIDLSSPQLLSLGSTILTHLRRSKQLTEAQTKLLEKAVPAALFAGEWRALAAQFTGKSRLMIRRIAASRGLGVEESTVLFDAVLLGETEGLGEGQPNGRPAEDLLRYEYTPAAAEGVLALGVRGRALVRDFLLGRRGTPMAREAIVTAARRQRATEFTPELKSAALSDKDEGVRASALEALSGMLRIEELVPAIRPLFSESSRDVLQPIAEFVAQNRAGFADHLTQGDIETIVASMLASSDSSLRGSVAGVLVNLNAHVPDELIEGSLTRLLLDEDKMARTEAIDVLPHFGARSVSALARALSDPDCERVLLPELARALTALARTEPRTTALLGQLIMLQKRFPRSAPLLEAIGAVADPQALALLEEQLQSDDAALRNAALAALTARQAFFSFSSEPYLAALIDAQIEDQVAKRFGEAFERLRPYSGAVPTSGAIARLPQFPWPPPQWSFKEVIPKSLIDAATLGGVSERLIGSLRAASRDYDYGLFEIPDGFVLLARLERIQPDGAPFSGRDRWNESTIPVRSLKDYLLELFLSPPGRFRIIAFAVAREEPLTGSATARLPTFGAGAKVLPQWIAQLPFVDREAYALVYTFQRYDGGKMVLNYAGSPSGLTHLIAAGIWGALQKSSRTADD